MSKKAIAEFLEASSKNKEMRDELRKHGDAMMKVAKAHGYKFTKKEFRDYLKNRWKKSDYEGPDICWVC